MLCRGKSSDVDGAARGGETKLQLQTIERLLLAQSRKIASLEQKVQGLTQFSNVDKMFVFDINLASQDKNRRGLFESLPFAFNGHVWVVEFGLASSQSFSFLVTLKSKSPLEEGGEIMCHISFRIEHPEQGVFRRRQANDADPYTFSFVDSSNASRRAQQLIGSTQGYVNFVDKSTLLREFQVSGEVKISIVMSPSLLPGSCNERNNYDTKSISSTQYSAERSRSTRGGGEPVVRSLSSLRLSDEKEDSKVYEHESESEPTSQNQTGLSKNRRHPSVRSQDDRQSSSPSPSPLSISSHSASPRGRGEVHQFARLSPSSLASPRNRLDTPSPHSYSSAHAASPSRSRSLPRAQTPTGAAQRSRFSYLPW